MSMSDRRTFLKTAAKVSAGIAVGTSGVEVFGSTLFPEHPTFDVNRSLWMRAQPPHNPPLDSDIDVDVVVVGGGYTGLSAAYHIALGTPARSVAVLEARGVGNGASGRNGAMLLPGTANEYMRIASSAPVHQHIYEATVASMRRLIALADASPVTGSIDPRGVLLTLNTPQQALEAQAYAAAVKRLGIPAEFWDRDRTNSAIGTSAFHGSLFDPNGGHVHPMKLAHVLKVAAESAGVHIYEDTPVVEIDAGRTVSLRTMTGGRVSARSLVLATNAYSSKLGFFRHAIVPVYSFVAATDALSAAQLSATGWTSRLPYSDSLTLDTYVGLGPDNRIHIGGHTSAYDFNNGVGRPADAREAAAAADLHATLGRLYPSLGNVDFELHWSGSVDMTVDWMPTVGVTGRHANVFYGLGYCGHGVNLSFLFGRIIADLEAGRGQSWAALPFVNRQPLYMPGEPWRWLGIQAEMAFYRLTDR